MPTNIEQFSAALKATVLIFFQCEGVHSMQSVRSNCKGRDYPWHTDIICMSTKVGFTTESHSLSFAKNFAYDKRKKEKFWANDQQCVSACWTTVWFWDQVRTSYMPSQEIP